MAEPVRKRSRPVSKTARGSIQTTKIVKVGDRVVEKPTVSRDFTEDLQDLRHAGSVSVGGGLTRNMGEFNSVKISVLISVPCDPSTDAHYDRARDRATRLLDRYLEEEYRNAVDDFSELVGD